MSTTPTTPRTPKLGDIVQYGMKMPGNTGETLTPLPAIVYTVNNPGDPESTLNLMVIGPFFHGCTNQREVRYSPTLTAEAWSWID